MLSITIVHITVIVTSNMLSCTLYASVQYWTRGTTYRIWSRIALCHIQRDV